MCIKLEFDDVGVVCCDYDLDCVDWFVVEECDDGLGESVDYGNGYEEDFVLKCDGGVIEDGYGW